MNRSYKTVWNASLGAWVAASELSKARGKGGGRRRSMLVAAPALLGSALLAGAFTASPAYADVAIGGVFVNTVVMRVGYGVFKGESAVGVSMRRTSDNNAWSLTGGVGVSRAGVAATVGAEWVFN